MAPSLLGMALTSPTERSLLSSDPPEQCKCSYCYSDSRSPGRQWHSAALPPTLFTWSLSLLLVPLSTHEERPAGKQVWQQWNCLWRVPKSCSHYTLVNVGRGIGQVFEWTLKCVAAQEDFISVAGTSLCRSFSNGENLKTPGLALVHSRVKHVTHPSNHTVVHEVVFSMRLFHDYIVSRVILYFPAAREEMQHLHKPPAPQTYDVKSLSNFFWDIILQPEM